MQFHTALSSVLIFLYIFQHFWMHIVHDLSSKYVLCSVITGSVCSNPNSCQEEKFVINLFMR